MERTTLERAKLAETQGPGAAVLHANGTELRLAGLAGVDWQSGEALGGVAGRGAVRCVDTELGSAVIRHYRRGGLLARLLGDRYFYLGAAKTRSFREFELLKRLDELALPVCRPLAARFVRSGLCWYRADLASALISGASSLHQILQQHGLQVEIAAAAGALIARFHAVGLWHADLNAHNILRDGDGEYWLIDLDRSRFRPIRTPWRYRNLQRLLRSLRKLGHLDRSLGSAQLNFVTGLWAAYEAGMAAVLRRTS